MSKVDEGKWKAAKQTVARCLGMPPSSFTDRELGLAGHVYHSVKKSSIDQIFNVYSIKKSGKKIIHQTYEDMGDAQEHVSNLRRLYGKFIQAGIEQKTPSRMSDSILIAKAVLAEREEWYQSFSSTHQN